MKTRAKALLLCGGVWVLSAHLTLSVASSYECQFLGHSNFVNAINTAGQVTGRAHDPIHYDIWHAFIYAGGAWTELPPLPGDRCSEGYGINSAGTVVGVSWNFGYHHPVIYPAGTLVAVDLNDLLPSGSGWVLVAARGINDSDQVTGYGYVSGALRGFVLSLLEGTIDEVPPLPGGTFSMGMAINNRGQVTGYARDVTGSLRAYVYSFPAGTISIDTWGGSHSMGYAINDAGQVTGLAYTAAGEERAFRYSPGVGMIDLHTVGEGSSAGGGINSAGHVVGWYALADGSKGGGFIYRSDSVGMEDIEELAGGCPSAWSFRPSGLNDRGQIIGDGAIEVDGRYQVGGFVLTPPSIPPTVSCPASFAVEASSASGAEVTLTFTVRDEDGDALSGVYSADGIVSYFNVPAGDPPPTSASFTITQTLGPGEHRFEVSVFDASNSDYCSTLVTVTEDGVPPEEEQGAPNAGDGNGDGIPDCAQPNVASFRNNRNGLYVTLETSAGVLAGVTPVPIPAGAPAGAVFPAGFFSFQVEGIEPASSVAVTLYLELPPSESVSTYWKHDPPPGRWYEFLWDALTGAEIGGYTSDGRQIVSLHFKDGLSQGDHDGLANGEISDPGGPVAEDNTPPAITCPGDINVPCSIDREVSVSFTPTATDNWDPSPQVVCAPPSGSGFPVGETTVTCTATDASGNSSSCAFKVSRAPLVFTGFLPPIGGADATGGDSAHPVRTFKMGSTIPFKFTLSCEGAAILTGAHTLKAIQFSGNTTGDSPIDATPQDAATTGNEFRLADGEWHFNLDTRATGMSVGVWKIIATLSDGSRHSAWIQLK